MEKLANNIAQKLASELNLNQDNKEVIAYGTFALLHMFLSIVLVTILGLMFHRVIEALLISFTTSLLRKYSGGVHTSSPYICMIVGTLLCIGQTLIVSYAVASYVNLRITILLGLLTFIYSYYIISKLAPVASPSKPIIKKERRNKMRRKSILILSFYLLASVVNIILYQNTGDTRFLLYSLCIYVGTVWQTFTLTQYGHLILGTIDTWLVQISLLKGGRKR